MLLTHIVEYLCYNIITKLNVSNTMSSLLHSKTQLLQHYTAASHRLGRGLPAYKDEWFTLTAAHSPSIAGAIPSRRASR